MPRHWMTIASSILLLTQTAWANVANDDIQRFTAVMQQVKQHYVKPVSTTTLVNHALDGMLKQLDDYSTYIDADEYSDMMATIDGDYAGVGMRVFIDKHGLLRVLAPLDNSPAIKAGIKPNDVILSIDGHDVKNMSKLEALKSIRGKPATTLHMTVFTPGEQSPRNLALTRQLIDVEPAHFTQLDAGVAYLRIPAFSKDTLKTVKHEIFTAKSEPITGLIIDVRNNPGGFLQSATGIADLFLDANQLHDNDVIVTVKGRSKSSSAEINASRGDILHRTPIVILINGGSASAAEVLASAMQDHHRATIIGQPSLGKGSVQSLYPISNKTAIKLTTAYYYSPDGHKIDNVGVTPNQPITHSTEHDTSLLYTKDDPWVREAATTLINFNKTHSQ